MAIGDLLDQWEIHKQFIGMAKPKVELFIDEVIPLSINVFIFHNLYVIITKEVYICSIKRMFNYDVLKQPIIY